VKTAVVRKYSKSKAEKILLKEKKRDFGRKKQMNKLEGVIKMKIAISADSENLNAPINPIFGRSPGFIIAETEENKIKNTKFIHNTAVSAGGGAGVSAAQQVINEKVDAVGSGNFGPNAFLVLKQAGIKMYTANNISIQEALEKISLGKILEINNSNAPDKFGMQGAGKKGGFGRGRGRGPPM
jgi:predicted Fe-Mo cluster-binding NifX family protein